MKKHSERGFTLMELMVVIVIVAILAAVAVPLYINYVKDAQRTEAKGAIGAIISAEQVYYQQKGEYNVTSTDLKTDLNVDVTDTQANWGFTLSAPAVGDKTTGFKIVADGNSGTKANASPAKGLKVWYEHNRTNGGTWGDETNIGGGGGGGGGTP